MDDRVRTAIYPNGGPTITNIFDTGLNLKQLKRVDAGGTNITYYSATGFDDRVRSVW